MPVNRPTPHWRRRIAGAAAVSVCALAFAGCGSTDERFNTGEKNRALDALNSIEDFVADGRCDAARRRSNALAIQSTHVSEDRPELGEAYASSVAHLQRLISRDCVEITPDGPTVDVTGTTGPTDDADRPEPSAPTDNPDNDNPNTNPPDNGNNQPDNNEPGGGGSQQPDPDTSGGAAPGA